jgi:capsular polysaccharide biosynthesis protein
LLLGIAFAVFVAAGATFVAEYFDDTFRTPEEMRRALNVPLIAAIPYCRALALGTGISDGLDGGKEVA